MGKFTIELHYYKGDCDWAGKTLKTDRYIILDSKGLDEIGQHFSKREATKLCKELNDEKKNINY